MPLIPTWKETEAGRSISLRSALPTTRASFRTPRTTQRNTISKKSKKQTNELQTKQKDMNVRRGPMGRRRKDGRGGGVR